MTFKRNAKRLVKAMMTQSAINSMIRKVLTFYPVSSVVPDRIKTRVPVVGETRFHLPQNQTLVLGNDGNDTIASRLYWLGFDSFEPETIQLLYKLLPGVNTFFDIGANTGLMALLAAIYHPQRQVHAFEPVPWIADAMKRNAQANKLLNIQVQAMALADFDGEIELFIPMDVGFPTGSSTVAGYREASQVIKVRAMKLDTYASLHDIKEFSLMKIDTETTEPAVLAGGINTLKTFQPTIICEVQPGKTEGELHRILDDLEYDFFHITEEV
jgi:FkbM family methyltransferase